MEPVDRHGTTPFMLRLFYRTGAFHRPDEFTTSQLPQHLTLHTWPSCTLAELSHHITSVEPPILPDPAIGTRLSFRLVFPDARSHGTNPSHQPRYMIKDLGSLVLGDGGPGLDVDDIEVDTNIGDREKNKSLADFRFVIGDYISVAILPPHEDGTVAPATDARMGRGSGAGEARALVGRPPTTAPLRENGFSRGGRGGRGGGRGYGGFGARGGSGSVPVGEWRRGERLPDAPPTRGRGRGRW